MGKNSEKPLHVVLMLAFTLLNV